MKAARNNSGREHGAALVVTLIVCVVLATVVVALIQSTTRDRYSSASVANYYRAQLAADSGLAAASALLDSQMRNDHFIVVANRNTRQLFVGTASNQTTPGAVAYRPAFCFGTNLSDLVSANPSSGNTVITTNALPSLVVPSPATSFIITNMAGGAAVSSPQVAWIYLTNFFTNSAGAAIVQTNARFTFWIEDLGGRLDLSVAGVASATDTNARRPTGTNPAELALWSLFNPSSSSDPGNALSTGLINARNAGKLPTPATAREVNPAISTNVIPALALGLRHDTNELELIPFGFGYTDAGKPKYNLNTNISAAGVQAIAAIMNNNLPQFFQRAGGYTNTAAGGATNANAYTGQSYLQTLAANIVDYADANSDPTTDGAALTTNRVRPVFRGIDSYPFVNEVSKRWVLTEHAVTNLGGVEGRGIKIETTDFFELWNPSSKTNNGSFTFVSVHQQTGKAGFGTFSFASPIWASNSSGSVSNGVTTNKFTVSSLRPNGFVVFACPTVTNFFFFPATNSNAVVLDQEINTSRYYTAWNGIFADAVLGGLYRVGPFSASGLRLNSPTNRANLPAFIYRNATAAANADPAVGDPRATIYLSLPVDATEYTSRTSFGGRNVRAGLTANSYGEVTPRTWPDFGHNSVAGTAAGNQTTLPTSLGLATYSNVPPGRISDSGSYSNIFELGAIFDPIQWTDTTGMQAGWKGKWTNLTTNAVADNGYGGGNSLRVGRSEHPRFTNNGLRASQLLDLFAAGAASATGPIRQTVAGRINLNTADANALRALAAGVYHSSDAALVAGGTNFVIPAAAVDAFVSTVTNRMAQQPFLSTAELPTLTNAAGAGIFGNPSLAAVSEWNDSAAEEWLTKVFPLATVRSRNFLIYAVGQSLNSWLTNQPIDARVSATSTKVFQVHVQPFRDASTGLTTNCVVRVLWSQEL